ncbi:SulP family inorganic anion transporter [Chloroflexota bacterium]
MASEAESIPAGSSKNLLHRYVPITAWLPKYERAWLRPDLMAGLAVWAMTIPQVMAYAGIAGVPAEYALYTVPLAMIAYAIFGTSRTLSVGPDSALAMLSAAAVGALATQGSQEYLELTFALALVAGVLFIIFGLLRMGWVANFLANPVLKGFMQGLALMVIVGQVPKLFGIEVASGNFFHELWAIITQLPQANLATTIVGLSSLALLFALKRLAPKLPGAFITVIVAILAVTIFDLTAYGVDVVGSVETGLPPLGIPDVTLEDLVLLVPGALAVVLLGYSKAYGMAKTAAETTGGEIDPDQEMIAYGLSNAASGLSSGFVVGGSLSRTSTILSAGGRSQVSSLVNAGLVILTLVLLMPLFQNLPTATLGAVVIQAIASLIKLGYFQRLYRVSRPEFWYSSVTFLGELLLGTLPGLAVGVVLSLLVIIRRVTRPGTAVIGRMPDHETYRNVTFYPEAETVPGLLIFRFDSALFFSSAEYFETEVLQDVAAAEEPVQRVLVDGETLNDIDTTGVDQLIKLHGDLERGGIELTFAEVRDPVRDMMRRAGGEEVIGTENFYGSVDEGVRAFLKREKNGS